MKSTSAGSRREFIKRATQGAAGWGMVMAGFPAILKAGKGNGASYKLDSIFPRYEGYDPMVPIWDVTPDMDRCFHRFHLSSPFSPSGRYLGLTRLPQEDRPPQPGEAAEVVLVDLLTGKQKVIAETRGWDTQLGAQVQWGGSDRDLYFNDVDTGTWIPFGVKMDPISGARIKLDGTVYDVSPDGNWLVSADLRRIGYTQAGYGLIVPDDYIPRNQGAEAGDGVFVTDTKTGACKMVASYRKIVEEARPKIDVGKYGPGDFYGFHTKWNAQSDRLMLVLRYIPHRDKERKSFLITMTREGEDIHVAIPASEWADKGGNHPNWHPDGKHVIMNLNLYRQGERFVKARYDGKGLEPMTIVPANRGHISVHPSGNFILNDAYPHKKFAFLDNTAPLWLIDLKRHWKYTLARFPCVTQGFADNPGEAGELRVDPHPVWDTRTHTHVAFNAVKNGTRHVFIADTSKFVPAIQPAS